MNEEQRAAADALMDQYMSALGDYAGTPLGQAGEPAAPSSSGLGARSAYLLRADAG